MWYGELSVILTCIKIGYFIVFHVFYLSNIVLVFSCFWYLIISRLYEWYLIVCFKKQIVFLAFITGIRSYVLILLYLIWLLFWHNRQQNIFIQPTLCWKFADFNCLCMTWGTSLRLHGVVQYCLFLFRQIRQFYCRTHRNLFVIDHFKDFWDKFCKADITTDLVLAFSNLLT